MAHSYGGSTYSMMISIAMLVYRRVIIWDISGILIVILAGNLIDIDGKINF